MTPLNDLALVAVGLQGSRRLLQGRQRQMIGGAQVIPVGVLMDGAIGTPAAGVPPVFGLAVSMEAPLRSHEAERDEGGQPVEPLRRVGSKRQQALTGADQHIAV